MFEIKEINYTNSKKTKIEVVCKIPIRIKNNGKEKEDEKFITCDYYYDNIGLVLIKQSNYTSFIDKDEFVMLDQDITNTIMVDSNFLKHVNAFLKSKFGLDHRHKIDLSVNKYENDIEEIKINIYDSIDITGEDIVQHMRKMKINRVLKE